MMQTVREQLRESARNLDAMASDAELIALIGTVAARAWRHLTTATKCCFAGNGGSAADAQHLAAELVSRYAYDRPGLPAFALTTDTSVLTAIGNDYGYERLFARQIEAVGTAGDVFFGDLHVRAFAQRAQGSRRSARERAGHGRDDRPHRRADAGALRLPAACSVGLDAAHPGGPHRHGTRHLPDHRSADVSADVLMEAIVLAGGLGTRLRGVVDDVPKPMAPVQGRPFLAFVLDQLVDAGFRTAIFAAGYRHEAIRSYFGEKYRGLELLYSVESEPLGTGGAIRFACEQTMCATSSC